jgi:hypothetical protein
MFRATVMSISVQELVCWILSTSTTLDIADKLGWEHNSDMKINWLFILVYLTKLQIDQLCSAER